MPKCFSIYLNKLEQFHVVLISDVTTRGTLLCDCLANSRSNLTILTRGFYCVKPTFKSSQTAIVAAVVNNIRTGSKLLDSMCV